MMRDEHEDYGDDSRDVIAGLRHLAQQSEAPAELLSTVMARGQQLLPRQSVHSTWWQRLLAPWHIRPLVWGPVVALVGFVAGAFVQLPLDTFPPPAPPAQQASQAADTSPRQSTEEPASPAPAPRYEQHRTAAAVQDEAERHTGLPAAAAPEEVGKAMLERSSSRFEALAVREAPRSQLSDAAAPVSLTVTLPAVLYEQLLAEAVQQHTDPSTLLHEAIEAYVERKK